MRACGSAIQVDLSEARRWSDPQCTSSGTSSWRRLDPIHLLPTFMLTYVCSPRAYMYSAWLRKLMPIASLTAPIDPEDVTTAFGFPTIVVASHLIDHAGQPILARAYESIWQYPGRKVGNAFYVVRYKDLSWMVQSWCVSKASHCKEKPPGRRFILVNRAWLPHFDFGQLIYVLILTRLRPLNTHMQCTLAFS